MIGAPSMSVEFGLSLHRLAVAGLLATVALATVGWDYADAARATRHEAKAARPDTRAPRHHARAHKRVIHGANYHPPYAEIAVDDNSGQVLREVNADEPRHPASLTKIMTLYLL